MFRMVSREGVDGPVPFCDYCGGRIEEAREGNYEWERSVDALDVPAEIFLSHKRCSRALERAHRKSDEAVWCNMELSVFPVYLGNAMQLDWPHARELAGFMASV